MDFFSGVVFDLGVCESSEQAPSVGSAGAGLPSGLPTRDGAQPPVSNRGVGNTYFSIDYLSLTVFSSPQFVASWLLAMLGVDGDLSSFVLQSHGAIGFRSLYVHSSGARLMCNPLRGEYCSVQMSVAVASTINPDALKQAIEHLDRESIRHNCSRIDAALDTDAFHPSEIFHAVKKDEMRSYAQRESLRRVDGFNTDTNYTVYLGSRQSERMLRCYRKEIDGVVLTRVEMEYKGARALRVLWDFLKYDAAEWAKRAMAHLLDFVDFTFEGWERFKGDSSRAYMVIHRLASSWEKTRAWLWQSAASAFAMLWDIDGKDSIDSLVLYGHEKFSKKHRAILQDHLGGVYGSACQASAP